MKPTVIMIIPSYRREICKLPTRHAKIEKGENSPIYWNYKSFNMPLFFIILKKMNNIRSDQSLSRVWLFATPWLAARQASLSITNSRSSLKLMSIESVMPSSHLILCHPLILLPLIPPSIRVFSNESTLCMRWPKYWSFSFSIIPSKEIPGLISFRKDWGKEAQKWQPPLAYLSRVADFLLAGKYCFPGYHWLAVDHI